MDKEQTTLMNGIELLPLFRTIADPSLQYLGIPPRILRVSAYFVHDWSKAQGLTGQTVAYDEGTKGLTTDGYFDKTLNFYFGVVFVSLYNTCRFPSDTAISRADRNRFDTNLKVPLSPPRGGPRPSPKESSHPAAQERRWSLETLRAAVLQILIHELIHLLQHWRVAHDHGKEAALSHNMDMQKKVYGSLPLMTRVFGSPERTMRLVYAKNPDETEAQAVAESFTLKNIDAIQKGDFDRYMPINQIRLYVR